MVVLNYSSFRRQLATVLDNVTENLEKAFIIRPNEKAVVVMSLDEYNSMTETMYLMKSRANYDSLLRSIEQVKNGEIVEVDDNLEPIQK